MISGTKKSKSLLAKELGISRSSLYYVSKQLPKDWALKQQIEEVLRDHPAYGSPRIRLVLGRNRKPIQRVMRLFGLKAYRRRGRKQRKPTCSKVSYPNLLLTVCPSYPHHIWVSDFTLIHWKHGVVYLATVMDLFSREIVGWEVLTTHTTPLILQALFVAIHHHERPEIFHSDNGSEYAAKPVLQLLSELGVKISRSRPASPWENGYQESFYSQFKVDLGDPTRFPTLGALVSEIYHLIWKYNHVRIHSALKMPPLLFLERYQKLRQKVP